MEILLNSLKRGHSYAIGHDIYWILFWALVTFIIGYLVIRSTETKKELEVAKRNEMKQRLRIAILNGNPEQIARAFGSLKTINIYWNKGFNMSLHQCMLGYIRDHLEMKGFKMAMDATEITLMRTWLNPVLVIYPERNVYFFHPNQQEDRTHSISLEIKTNCINTLKVAVDEAIKELRG